MGKKFIALALLVITLLSVGSMTAYAAAGRYTYNNCLFICTTGGRQDIDLGTHGNIEMDARFSHKTRVILYNSLWKEVWSGDFSGSWAAYLNPFCYHVIKCGSNVRYVSIFLDNDKSVVLRSSAQRWR